MKRSLLALGLVGAVSCGAAPQPVPVEDEVVTGAVEPGIALSIDFRGRRIDVAADGVLNAEGCAAARYDWERQALIGADGVDLEVAAATTGVDILTGERHAARTVRAPDGTELATILASSVVHGPTELLRIESDGSLMDATPGGPPASTNIPVPEGFFEPVLSLVTLVGVCWETHPRPIPER